MTADIDERLRKLGYTLPEAPKANGHYLTSRLLGNRLVTSGQLSRSVTGLIRGPLTTPSDVQRGAEAAQLCALRCLSAARTRLGTFDHVAGVISVRGFIAAAPGFEAHSTVLDGASELLVELFGAEVGGHVRSAIGVSSLPDGGAVEIETEFAVRI